MGITRAPIYPSALGKEERKGGKTLTSISARKKKIELGKDLLRLKLYTGGRGNG